MSGDPYIDPATGILRNKLGLSDATELSRVEGRLTAITLAELGERPEPGAFDLPHLQRIHGRLFAPIYDWAGDLRTVDMAKNNVGFCPARMIPSYARDVFNPIERGPKLGAMPYNKALDRLVRHIAEINVLHPFREGNGRATRAFFTQWAGEASVRIDWARIDPERNGHAFRESILGRLQPLRDMIADLAAPAPSRDRDTDRGR